MIHPIEDRYRTEIADIFEESSRINKKYLGPNVSSKASDVILVPFFIVYTNWPYKGLVAASDAGKLMFPLNPNIQPKLLLNLDVIPQRESQTNCPDGSKKVIVLDEPVLFVMVVLPELEL